MCPRWKNTERKIWTLRKYVIFFHTNCEYVNTWYTIHMFSLDIAIDILFHLFIDKTTSILFPFSGVFFPLLRYFVSKYTRGTFFVFFFYNALKSLDGLPFFSFDIFGVISSTSVQPIRLFVIFITIFVRFRMTASTILGWKVNVTHMCPMLKLMRMIIMLNACGIVIKNQISLHSCINKLF